MPYDGRRGVDDYRISAKGVTSGNRPDGIEQIQRSCSQTLSHRWAFM